MENPPNPKKKETNRVWTTADDAKGGLSNTWEARQERLIKDSQVIEKGKDIEEQDKNSEYFKRYGQGYKKYEK